MTGSPNNLEGWSIYPRNLCLSAAEVDAKGYDRRLAQVEKRLFAGESVDFDEGTDLDEDENVAQILDLGSVRQDGSRHSRYAAINSPSELTELCQRPRCSWVFFLHQYDSWGQLRVSAEFLKKLFSFLRVHPGYLDIVFLFAEKSDPVEQSFSSLFSHCRPLSTGNPADELMCSYGENTRHSQTHTPCVKLGYIMASTPRRSRPSVAWLLFKFDGADGRR
ncbi:uncharacterized protein BDW70DRAFT_168212 [Aspergillus foveolatus]|uniref:uncharacterized protein n=1 Tax=Aspergillus foveolatus TaxID=210207 RepID=UPI003CCCA9AA